MSSFTSRTQSSFLTSTELDDNEGEGDNLRGILQDADINGMRRLGGGAFGDVFQMNHHSLGSIALKRVVEHGSDSDILERRRVRSNGGR